MIKEIKYGGYTVSPSDYDSPDGDLALSFNLVPKNGELHGMHTPSTIGSLQEGEELIFIHTVNDNTSSSSSRRINHYTTASWAMLLALSSRRMMWTLSSVLPLAMCCASMEPTP